MSENPTVVLMTSEEFEALPERKGLERWLVNGVLRERRMTKRNIDHCGATAALTCFLYTWLIEQPKPRGKIYNGDAYFRISRVKGTNVGIDVAYASAELVASRKPKAKYLDGPPILAVEVLSPNDKHREVTEKIRAYLDGGVKAVWIVDPDLWTVTVHRPEADPLLFSRNQVLTGDPELPGLRIAVADIFED